MTLLTEAKLLLTLLMWKYFDMMIIISFKNLKKEKDFRQ